MGIKINEVEHGSKKISQVPNAACSEMYSERKQKYKKKQEKILIVILLRALITKYSGNNIDKETTKRQAMFKNMVRKRSGKSSEASDVWVQPGKLSCPVRQPGREKSRQRDGEIKEIDDA